MTVSIPESTTLRQALARAAAALRERAPLRQDAARDVELLLLRALGATRAELLTHPERVLTPEERASFAVMLERRLGMEPVQYIVGEQEFFGLALEVTAAVLIPRPETELLVEAVLERLSPEAELRIVDVGTGSGAIAIALAVHLPRAKVVALDVSEGALEVARRNVERHGLSGRVEVVRSDLLTEVAGSGLCCDAVVSNPPYISEGERGTLHPQVREFEPALALFAGADGMEVYDRLVPQAGGVLRPGGLLAMEMGEGQSSTLVRCLRGWEGVEVLQDLRGIARVVLARRGK